MRSIPAVMALMSATLIVTLAATLATILATTSPARAEAAQLRIGVQYGTSMLAVMLMERDHLVERRAAAAGLGDVAVSYRNIGTPVAMSDGVLSGALDIGINGAPSVLLLWDKTRNAANPVRGLAAVSTSPSVLVTRNPAVHSIRDFTEADRIAVPGVKISINALLLQMGAQREWGPDGWNRLDARTTSLGHPDAMTAMLSGKGEITAHFSGPPFSTIEARNGGRAILTAKDVLGDGWDMIMFMAAVTHDANPRLVGAVLAALQDAMDSIRKDPRAAAEAYLAISRDTRSSVDDIVAIITDPGQSYTEAPHSVLQFARFMHGIGLLKTGPARWQDAFFPDVGKDITR